MKFNSNATSAVSWKYPEVEFSAQGDDDNLMEFTWVVGTVTDANITAAISEYADYLVSTQYKKDRKYPPIGDQLDALFHAGVFPAEMAAEIQAVKDKYPK
jgi:hypothetical protein